MRAEDSAEVFEQAWNHDLKASAGMNWDLESRVASVALNLVHNGALDQMIVGAGVPTDEVRQEIFKHFQRVRYEAGQRNSQ